MSEFATLLIAWQKRHGRKGLPWQGVRDPYRVWLSEVMLQQTQVSAVLPYYERFLAAFPDVHALAAAPQDEVLRLWSGLGYYARARNLHAAAKLVARGGFPRDSESISQLPGVGRSTAAAIAAFAFGERAAILDGNVKRVLARQYGVPGFPGERAVEQKLWALADRLLPASGIEIYTQALMDLGATVCTKAKPRCAECPASKSCVARKRNVVESIPAPRPAKALPQKAVRWLVLLHNGSVLLEKRPPSGIWGGLWSFPEAMAADAFGCVISRRQDLAPLQHGFTHFRLTIHPVLCEVRKTSGGASEANGRMWVDVEDALDAAVPTPVRKVLGTISGARGGPARRPARGATASGRAAAARPRASRSGSR